MSLRETGKPLLAQRSLVCHLTYRTRPEYSVNIPSLWSTGAGGGCERLGSLVYIRDCKMPDLKSDLKILFIFISLLICVFVFLRQILTV